MAIHPKMVIRYAELLAKVQGVLTSYPQECRNIHVDALEIYRESVDGANWDIRSYRRSGDDNDWTECSERIMNEIRLLRESYDVGDK